MQQTIQPAGYIVTDNEAVYGVGATADEAWDDMLREMSEGDVYVIDDRAFRSAEQEAADEAIQEAGASWTKASNLHIRSASAALLALVENHGGAAIAWATVNGVCCTRDEAC